MGKRSSRISLFLRTLGSLPLLFIAVLWAATGILSLFIPILGGLNWLFDWHLGLSSRVGRPNYLEIPTNLRDFLGIETIPLFLFIVSSLFLFYRKIWSFFQKHWFVYSMCLVGLSGLAYSGYPRVMPYFKGGELLYRVESNNVALLEEVLQKSTPFQGGLINYQVFMRAVENDCDLMIPVLVKHGFTIDERGPDGYTPLMMAIHFYSPHMVKILLENGASAKALGPKDEALLFMALRAVERTPVDRLAIIKSLLDAGAPLNVKNEWGETPSQVANVQGYVAVEALLSFYMLHEM